MTYKCPADGCDYSGELGSVCGHYGGMQDDDHKGSYQSCRNMLEASADGSQNDPGGGDLEFPESPGSSDPDSDPEPKRTSCPECGSGNFASSELTLSTIPDLSDRARAALSSHDYHCHDCGEVFDL